MALLPCCRSPEIKCVKSIIDSLACLFISLFFLLFSIFASFFFFAFFNFLKYKDLWNAEIKMSKRGPRQSPNRQGILCTLSSEIGANGNTFSSLPYKTVCNRQKNETHEIKL